jgi:hypothetical protein
MSLDGFAAYHMGEGRNAVPLVGEPDLRDNPDLWRALWARHRDELIAEHARASPGSRPAAFWRFDSGGLPGRIEGESGAESDVEYLHRLGLLPPSELDAIRKRAVKLVAYNSGRSPERTSAGYFRDNFIPASDLHRFAARHGLITPQQAAILGLNAKGERIHEHRDDD